MTSRRANVKTASAVPAIRCAIYTRKSSEEGLAQEFNSLDAQREAAEAYIASQKAEGWLAFTYKVRRHNLFARGRRRGVARCF